MYVKNFDTWQKLARHSLETNVTSEKINGNLDLPWYFFLSYENLTFSENN